MAGRHPVLAEELEAEPPRPATTMPAPAGSSGHDHASVRLAASNRDSSAKCLGEDGAGQARLDLNRATPAELARVAGISWRLAARIIAARDAFESVRAPAASL